MISISDLFSTSTRDEVFNTFAGILASLNLKVTSWAPGANARTLLVGIAQKFSDLTQVIAEINKGGFRETATGNWLVMLSRNMYGVDGIAAAAGTTDETFTNASAVPYGPFNPGDVTLENAVTKKQYKNTATLTVPALGSVISPIISSELGSGSSATPGQISTLISPSMPGVTVTNANALVGVDAETDDALRQRDLDKLGAVSPNGPIGAYAYYAKTAKKIDGTYVDVNRVKVVGASGAVTVTVASTSGAVPGNVGTPGTDLYIVDQSVQLNAVPVGITATVQSATTQTVALTYTAWVSSKANRSSADIQTSVATQIAKFFSALPIGGVVLSGLQGYVFIDALKEQIFRSVTDPSGVSYVRDVDISIPAADVALTGSAVAVLGTTTAIINFVTEL